MARLYSKSQLAFALSMRRELQKLEARPENARKQFAILEAGVITTTERKRRAMEWLLSSGWTAEEIKLRLSKKEK